MSHSKNKQVLEPRATYWETHPPPPTPKAITMHKVSTKKKKRKKTHLLLWYLVGYWWYLPGIMKNKMKKGHFQRQNAPSSTPSIFWNALWFLQDRFGLRFQFFEMPCGLCKAGSNQCCIFHNALARFLQDRFQSVMWPSLDALKKKCMCLHIWTRVLNFSLAHEANWIQVFYLLHSNVEQDLVTKFKPFPAYYIFHGGK